MIGKSWICDWKRFELREFNSWSSFQTKFPFYWWCIREESNVSSFSSIIFISSSFLFPFSLFTEYSHSFFFCYDFFLRSRFPRIFDFLCHKYLSFLLEFLSICAWAMDGAKAEGQWVRHDDDVIKTAGCLAVSIWSTDVEMDEDGTKLAGRVTLSRMIDDWKRWFDDDTNCYEIELW